jgi:preprotein translocase subunit SecG
VTIFLTVVHVLVCILLVGVVLLQRGKGAEIGAVFGGGASSTVFGSRGAGNFLTRLTTGAAIVFMLTSLSLAYFAQERSQGTLFDEEEAAQEAPAASPFAEPGGAEGGAGEQGSPFQEVPAPAPAAEAGAGAAGGEAAAPAAAQPAAAQPAAPGERAGEAPAQP